MDCWQDRCYRDGIPDTVPNKLLFSGRVPSWKAIAICLLNNDMQLERLGFSRKKSTKGLHLEAMLKRQSKDNPQNEMF